MTPDETFGEAHPAESDHPDDATEAAEPVVDDTDLTGDPVPDDLDAGNLDEIVAATDTAAADTDADDAADTAEEN